MGEFEQHGSNRTHDHYRQREHLLEVLEKSLEISSANRIDLLLNDKLAVFHHKNSIDDYANDGGKKLFTKMHCVL